MDSRSWELKDDVLDFELCVILIAAVSVTVHALFAWKSIFHQAGGLFVVLGERYCSRSWIWGIRSWCSGMFIFMSRRGPVSPWPDPMVYDLIKKTWMMTLPNSSETYSKITIVENWDSAMLAGVFNVWWGYLRPRGHFRTPLEPNFITLPRTDGDADSCRSC